MNRVATIASACVMSSALLAGLARGEGLRALSEGAIDPTGSIVESFLQSKSPELAALEGSFATSAPALSMPPGMLEADLSTHLALTRPRAPGETDQSTSSSSSKKDPVARRVKPQTSPDALEVSRTAFPLVVGAVPAPLAEIRPMVGPVVGVRPAYVRPASFR